MTKRAVTKYAVLDKHYASHLTPEMSAMDLIHVEPEKR